MAPKRRRGALAAAPSQAARRAARAGVGSLREHLVTSTTRARYDEALQRFQEIAATGIDFVRIVPGSRDMPAEVAGPSIQAIAQIAQRLSS